MEENIDLRLESKLGFDRVREIISNRCSTEYASEKAKNEKFINDASQIAERLLLTDEMRLIVMFEDRFPTGGYIDCLDFLLLLEKEGYNIDLLSLGKLRTMLDTVRKIIIFFSGIKDGVYPHLKRMSSPIISFPEVQRRIDVILDKFGNIKDTASDTLYDIRKSIKDKEGAISKRANAILKKAQQEGLVDTEANVAIRDGKMLIPVSTANKRKISGFVYEESASGKTTFILPAEIVEIENELNELRFAESAEIVRILSEFSDFVRPYVPDLMTSARYLGEIDFLYAKAQVALDFIAGIPIISKDGEMNIRKARHPLLEKALKKENKEIVPLTVTLSPKKRILLISGPNAGGKSVCLKTVGLLQYMFQWGMLIPTSESSEMTIFDRIMVSIGDNQSIDNDLSTYSSFLADMKSMLSQSDSNTLVLIDEFGSGTEPAAGGAIAEAILSELDRRGAYGVITTHYTNLKLYASGKDTGVINGAMQFDVKNIAPLFKLDMGLPGNSFAFELARKMGLPEDIIKNAEDRAGEEYVGIERNLRRIARNRKALDEKLQKIKFTNKNLENITGKYQKELEEIKQKRDEILDEAKKEAETIIKEANRKVENTIRTIKEAQAEKSATKEARKGLELFIGAIEQRKVSEQKNKEEYLNEKLKKLETRNRKIGTKPTVEPEKEKFRSGPIAVGEKVRIKTNGKAGEVLKVSDKAVTVIVGNITTKLPLDKVERISSNEYKETVRKTITPVSQKVDTSLTERRLAFKLEIDVRGHRLSEALEEVTRYIDDAIMLDMNSVRIIHGKGTGVLREELQKYIKTIPGVLSVKDEQIQLGGSGVTVVSFK